MEVVGIPPHGSTIGDEVVLARAHGRSRLDIGGRIVNQRPETDAGRAEKGFLGCPAVSREEESPLLNDRRGNPQAGATREGTGSGIERAVRRSEINPVRIENEFVRRVVQPVAGIF